jgi:hypothetical protein
MNLLRRPNSARTLNSIAHRDGALAGGGRARADYIREVSFGESGRMALRVIASGCGLLITHFCRIVASFCRD